MKKNVLILVFSIMLSILAAGQEQRRQLMEVKVTPPSFTGIKEVAAAITGDKTKSIGPYLIANFEYPKNIYNAQGTEVVSFTIAEDGKLTDFKVINSVSDDIDTEIIRLLKTTCGMWSPGYNNGVPVAMDKEVALVIKTDELENYAVNNDFVSLARGYFNRGTKNLLTKGKAKRALKNLDNAIRFLPYDNSVIFMRGLCRYEVGDVDGARNDWRRLKELGGLDYDEVLLAKIKEMKGYEEFAFMFEK